MRTCTVCKVTKEPKEFHKRAYARSGYTSYCKACKIAYDKDYVYKNRAKSKVQDKLYREMNKDKLEQYGKNYYKANKEKVNKKNNKNFYMQKYGITLERKLEMIKEQENKCFICSVTLLGTLDGYVDHDHKTGKVRAILCRYCNMGLGSFRDTPALLVEAVKYLKLHGKS